ncbi:MAG: hypothetical protein ABI127_09685 [Dokdonella sp.]
MIEEEFHQNVLDDEHLRLLSYGYVLSGVMTGLFSLIGLLYAGMGLVMSRVVSTVAQNGTHADQVPPEVLFNIFILFGFVFFLAAITLAAVKLWTARCIRQRRSRMVCMIVAGICCLGIPYGTVLGVCTFLVLGRQSVVSGFDRNHSGHELLP